MSATTHIEWTDATWNPFGGCSVTSPGCTNCYAMRIAGSGRLRDHPLYAGVTTPSKAGPVFNGTMTVAADDAAVWSWPMRWRGAKAPRLGAGKPSMIFVGDMADIFHESRPDEVIDRVFAVMALCPQHIFQVLTKRPERLREYVNNRNTGRRIYELVFDLVQTTNLNVALVASPLFERFAPAGRRRVHLGAWPLSNVWLGVSVEDQARANERIPLLLATPAAKRFISGEPLLGPLYLNNIRNPARFPRLLRIASLEGCEYHEDDGNQWTPAPQLDWVIVGGESGPGARPMHPDWVRSMRDQCAEARVPFFFKQWGEWVPHTISAGGDLGADVRAGRVMIVHPSGRDSHEIMSETGTVQSERGSRYMARVGKKAAGALLDGVMHREFPA